MFQLYFAVVNLSGVCTAQPLPMAGDLRFDLGRGGAAGVVTLGQ